MPAIWNVNNAYNTNEKKLSSKLTFEVGEKFSGRIVNKGEGKEVLVKLADGWQFAAEIDGEYNVEEEGLVRFEVEGFQDGKLKLKIIRREQGGQNSSADSLGEIINKEGLSKEDLSLLRMMVKHNIPLTKDNITLIKGLIQFNDKIKGNQEEIDNFIEKFLMGKGIAQESEEGKNIKNMLREFFNSFETMKKDDILLFLENNIEINKENIDSYNKLFKGQETIMDYFDKLGNDIKELDLELPVIKGENTSENKGVDSEKLPADKEGNIINSNKNTNLASKIYDSNDVAKGKVSMLSLLKSMVGSEMELSKEMLKEVLISRVSEFTTKEYNKAFSEVNNISDKELLNSIRNNLSGDGEITKEAINKAVSNILGKNIEITDGEFQKFKDILLLKKSDTDIGESKQGINSESIREEINNDTGTEIVNKDESSKGKTTNQGVTNVRIDDKESISNKEINKNNILSSKETVNNDNISNKSINGAVIEELMKNEEKAVKGNITETMIKEKILMSSKDMIREDIKSKIEAIREVVKEIISHTEVKGQGLEKVMEFIKSNVNDFKLLNSISNEYYYLDIPVNKDQKEYPCKIVIKDNRKEGKKVDTTNVKLVVSVKTINLGTIDGYLSIKNNRLDVDLKCDEKVVKALDLGKEKLIKGLGTLGFAVNVIVTKRTEEVSLTSCRDFFNEHNTRVIDTKV